ncbi:prepilin peptidase [Actinomadura hibisca]|uniref:prepilin peptidase n=1 Tax=Actinomadura hibisca TaxID=68565 RepID=UPI00082E2001|nr:A24 family peptidase [Actinomadura hibisca]
MITLLAVLLGAVAGLLLAPLARPYVEDVPRSHRIVVAALTAGGFGLFGWRAGWQPVTVALLYLVAVGVLLCYIDVRVKRLPDRFTLTSYGIGLVLLGAAAPFTENGLTRFGHALVGMVALFLLYVVQVFLVPSGLGLGDVKLSGALGLYLGWFGTETWVMGLLLSYFAGGFAAIGIMIVRRTRKGDFPFGPYMIVGTLAAVLLAPGIAG